MSLKFYLTIIKHSLSDAQFRAGAWHETWAVLRDYLPGWLVTPRSQYIFCRYAGAPSGKGRWLPPQKLRYRPSAYALIFDEAGRILMVASKALDTRWTLPGGGVNKGETLVQGLHREVREETGLEVDIGPLLDARDIFRIMPTGRPVQAQLHYYLARPSGGQLRPQGNGFDSSVVAYLDPAKLPDHDLYSPGYLLKLMERAAFYGPALDFPLYVAPSDEC